MSKKKVLPLIQSDPYLEPFANAIQGRYDYFQTVENKLTGGNSSLSDFATGYLYFGLHQLEDTWVFREWAPNATAIYLIGDFNNWEKNEKYRLKQINSDGVWQIILDKNSLKHEMLYKLWVEWEGGAGERIPAWTRRVIQDDVTKVFSSQVWQPENEYKFKVDKFVRDDTPLLIYECHIGMSSNEEKVSTYEEFRRTVLPRIVNGGYNCIQIMAIQEHPYYGSFGYHVSNFFAASSRFGTPEELKRLIDQAHEMGVAVIMDIVHSHAVKNEKEGLGLFDGTPYQYFHGGDRREHPQWDSLLFDYGKPSVLHFLLSNVKFWMDEFKFDGFRFDGVTSMLYRDHGLGVDFMDYSAYYNLNQDGDAIAYLTLANKLIHQVNPNAISIAEEMSGMPGLATKVEDGGIGFDYRMAMGIPDFWIKYIKEIKFEDWKVGHIFWEMTNRRAGELTVSYAESHDQALVGDKTIIFRLIDADMYWHMKRGDETLLVSRGVAFHKMIRLVTASTINGAYLNFMGNEFGHPEWVDFPREGNDWSYKYARRQWELVDNPDFLYHGLGKFDKAMLELIKTPNYHNTPIYQRWDKEGDQVLAYQRGDLLFVYNFNIDKSYTDYGILAEPGKYQIVLNSDNPMYEGHGLIDETVVHFTQEADVENVVGMEWLKLYLPASTAIVLRKQK